MKKDKKITPEQKLRAIGHIRNYLMNTGNPRIQMLFILSILFIIGFLISSSLYKIGIEKMWIRYSITLFLSYFSFFVLIRIWSIFAIKNMDIPPKQFYEHVDLEQNIEINLRSTRFTLETSESFSNDSNFSSSSDSSIFDWIIDHEYSLLIALFAIISISILFLCGYVLFVAPMFFSEILFELLILSVVFKQVKKYQTVGWYEVVFVRTIIPFASVLIVFTLTGYIIQSYFPEIKTLKEVIDIINHH